MKKTLLLAAVVLATAATAKADYSEYFQPMYNGQPIQNGSVVTVNHYSDENMNFEAIIPVANKLAEGQIVYGALRFTDNPTYDMAMEDMTKWGMAQLCFGYNNGGGGNCLGGNPPVTAGAGEVTLPASTEDRVFQWELHLNVTTGDVVSEYDLVMNSFVRVDDPEGDHFDPETGDPYYLEPVEGSDFKCTIRYDKNAAVADLEADPNAPAEYYNLQGVRVFNPEKGIFIKVQGGKVTKVAID